MKELLKPLGKEALQEELLADAGFSHLTRPDVETYLNTAAETFNRAVQVYRSPIPLGFKLQLNVRPYVLAVAAEMIEDLLAEIGWETKRQMGKRQERAAQLMDKVFAAADEIIKTNPEIKD